MRRPLWWNRLRTDTEQTITELAELIDLANRYLSRLFKVEHYYNRMRDMEITIAQMGTVMQSMADPVILTDTQHRVIMQNKAAERFFRVPEEMTEGLARAVEFNNLLFPRRSLPCWFPAVIPIVTSRWWTRLKARKCCLKPSPLPPSGRTAFNSAPSPVMRDVTDLRRADQELRLNYERLSEAEEVVRQDRDRLNLIIENVGDPIVVCDGKAKIVLVDPLAQELFGTEMDVVRDTVQFQNQTKLTAFIDAFTSSFSERETAPLRLYNPTLRQDIDYDARSGKIYGERGQVAYTVTVLRDLTRPAQGGAAQGGAAHAGD